MTQIQSARKGIVTKEITFVSEKENSKQKTVLEETAKGRAVIPANKNHKNLKPIIIGSKFSTKINANIGTSKDFKDIEVEKQKLAIAVQYGADAVMDLSTGGDLDSIRIELINSCSVPFGTVPIYQVLADDKDFCNITATKLINAIEKQAKQGVDFMTVHSGITLESIPLIKNRITGVVSRGGSILIAWMKYHNKENPMYTDFDRILDIAKEYDITLSLGDGLRPGCLADATDSAQISELKKLGELTLRAWEKGVQVMIEGPGHVPVNEIQENVELEKKYCHEAPFYVLGPLVTDIAPGYDHIVGAMGGLIAAYHGAAMLCYVTPREHLGLPNIEDVKQGVIAFKIAAHAADVGRGIPHAKTLDNNMSKARKSLKWEEQFKFAIDPETARKYYTASKAGSDDVCSMCSEFCSMKLMNEVEQKQCKP